jgi:hypothetical protein
MPGSERDYEGGEKRLSLAEFEASSNLGCVLCGMVHKVVMHFLGDKDVKEVGIVGIHMGQSLEIWFAREWKGPKCIEIELHRPPGKEFRHALTSPSHSSFYIGLNNY